MNVITKIFGRVIWGHVEIELGKTLERRITPKLPKLLKDLNQVDKEAINGNAESFVEADTDAIAEKAGKVMSDFASFTIYYGVHRVYQEMKSMEVQEVCEKIKRVSVEKMKRAEEDNSNKLKEQPF